MKAQSAMEFLTTYGWAIIILVVVLAFIVFLLSSLNSAVPNTCIFNSGFSCSDFLIESNSISTSVLLLLSNTAKYPIESATVSANISTLGQIVAHCSPGYILPGGDLICIGTTSNTLKNNINLNGVARNEKRGLSYEQMPRTEDIKEFAKAIAEKSGYIFTDYHEKSAVALLSVDKKAASERVIKFKK